jgi:hypothetical protein
MMQCSRLTRPSATCMQRYTQLVQLASYLLGY